MHGHTYMLPRTVIDLQETDFTTLYAAEVYRCLTDLSATILFFIAASPIIALRMLSRSCVLSCCL